MTDCLWTKSANGQRKSTRGCGNTSIFRALRGGNGSKVREAQRTLTCTAAQAEQSFATQARRLMVARSSLSSVLGTGACRFLKSTSRTLPKRAVAQLTKD